MRDDFKINDPKNIISYRHVHLMARVTFSGYLLTRIQLSPVIYLGSVSTDTG